MKPDLPWNLTQSAALCFSCRAPCTWPRGITLQLCCSPVAGAGGWGARREASHERQEAWCEGNYTGGCPRQAAEATSWLCRTLCALRPGPILTGSISTPVTEAHGLEALNRTAHRSTHPRMVFTSQALGTLSSFHDVSMLDNTDFCGLFPSVIRPICFWEAEK